MDNATYASLTRQSGLRTEMQVIAHNIANSATTGFQKEGLIFSEVISAHEDADTSLSMATANARMIDRSQGQMTNTGGLFDLALEGDGYFMVQTPEGNQLTRSGVFYPDANGFLSATDGSPVLDEGQAPIFVPPGVRDISIGRDGSISANGQPVGRIGVFEPVNPELMGRAGSVRLTLDGDAVPIQDTGMVQGFLESSNVDPVLEVARMIEVQRAYERGRDLMSKEDERIRGVIQTLGQ
jgi:flagellar basal-body rod protein FlgF